MFSNKSLLASVAKPILFFYFFASALSSVAATGIAQSDSIILKQFHFIPYPQKVELKTGTLAITVPPEIIVATGAGIKEKIGKQQLQAFFSRMHSSPGVKPVKVILGSIDKQKYLSRWLSPKEKSTLAKLNSQGYILQINKNQIVIVGRTGQGALYGVQTLLQMLKNAKPGIRLPLLTIEDWPAVANRYVDVTLAWYAYYFGFGYGSQLWNEGQWHWFMDWCLDHKINGIDLCIYGYWPFKLPEYPKTTLTNIPVKTYDTNTGKTVTISMTHPNIVHEFLPALIRYAQQRGIRVNAYIGLNTFNGGYIFNHPEAGLFLPKQWKNIYGRNYALDLTNDSVRRYLRYSVRKIMQMGFDGITFEMDELPASVCAKPGCVIKYWAGYENKVTKDDAPAYTPLPVRIRADADLLNDLYRVITQVNPRADVGLIYHRIAELYGWGPATLQAFKQFRAMIPKRVYFLQGPRAPRDSSLEGSQFARWVNIADPKTYRHSDNIGGDAAFYHRLLYINNDPATRGDKPVPSLEWEIAQHRAAAQMHLQGATGYAFEWYGNEIYPLILAQYSWKPDGPDGVSDHGFLEYAEQSMYGNHIGTIAAKALSLSPPPTDHYPSAWPGPANEAADLAKQALDEYTAPDSEYRKGLEQIYTSSHRKAGLYEVEKLENMADTAKGAEKKLLLEQALAKAKQVGDLVLNGKPADNYRMGFFGTFEIFEMIEGLSGKLGVPVEDRFKPFPSGH
jgi:hypothetical protein